MKTITTLLLMLGLVAAGQAMADPPPHFLADARRLLASCTSEAPVLRAMCLGYLGAIADGTARHQTIRSTNETVCVPAAVNLEAYRQIFVVFVTKQPEATQWQSYEAMKAAMETEWPCSG